MLKAALKFILFLLLALVLFNTPYLEGSKLQRPDAAVKRLSINW